MKKLSQLPSQSQSAFAKLPYDPLDPPCPTCKAYSGRACISSRRKRLRYPHIRRVELAAALYRSEIRRQILDRARRGPFALAFSSRRMAAANFNVRQAPRLEGALP